VCLLSVHETQRTHIATFVLRGSKSQSEYSVNEEVQATVAAACRSSLRSPLPVIDSIRLKRPIRISIAGSRSSERFSSDAKATSMPTCKSGRKQQTSVDEMHRDASHRLQSCSAVRAFLASAASGPRAFFVDMRRLGAVSQGGRMRQYVGCWLRCQPRGPSAAVVDAIGIA